MSDLIDHAEHELALLGGEDDPMQQEMNKHILAMVKLFADEGHSGFSAGYAIRILEKLLRFEPITPLTGADDEWREIGGGVFQNKRCSRVFKGADGKAYDIDGRVFIDDDGFAFTCAESLVYITFPYVPKTERLPTSQLDALRAEQNG